MVARLPPHPWLCKTQLPRCKNKSNEKHVFDEFHVLFYLCFFNVKMVPKMVPSSVPSCPVVSRFVRPVVVVPSSTSVLCHPSSVRPSTSVRRRRRRPLSVRASRRRRPLSVSPVVRLNITWKMSRSTRRMGSVYQIVSSLPLKIGVKR